ncbi:cell division protein FtsB [Lysobacter sp. TY2-98]|uniref:cell division protein FtsB n=1 Tax=Lysobacter sp. TY2-98 TaxID=2290922 RepID=UPI000E2081A0|nr:cell division protein FtsB [Lysobacter sp. TY2-98]AXK72425.1 cell division protein FtsB [Lysobacter sp. TY2-98]
MARARYGLLILIGLLAVLLVGLQTRLWRGEGGREAVDALQRQVDAQVHENGGLQQRNAALAAEVEDLKSGEAAVEDRARSELGMIKPGEVFYRVVENTRPVQKPADTAAAPPAP